MNLCPFHLQEVVLSEYDLDEVVKKLKRNTETENNALDMMMKASQFKGAKGRGGRGRRAAEIIPPPQNKVNPAEVFIEHRVRELLKKTKEMLTGKLVLLVFAL